MFDSRKIHLIPPAVIDKVESMLNENVRPETRNIHATSIEAIRDFCVEALRGYDALKSTISNKKRR